MTAEAPRSTSAMPTTPPTAVAWELDQFKQKRSIADNVADKVHHNASAKQCPGICVPEEPFT